MEERLERLNRLFDVVKSTKDIRAKSDLYKVYSNCRKIVDNLSNEEIECRRLRRVTPKYTDLLLQLDNSMDEFEQWITFSKLLY